MIHVALTSYHASYLQTFGQRAEEHQVDQSPQSPGHRVALVAQAAKVEEEEAEKLQESPRHITSSSLRSHPAQCAPSSFLLLLLVLEILQVSVLSGATKAPENTSKSPDAAHSLSSRRMKRNLGTETQREQRIISPVLPAATLHRCLKGDAQLRWVFIPPT